MEGKTCKTCEHFWQHYIKAGENYHWVKCGDCTYPELEKSERDTPACDNYKELKE